MTPDMDTSIRASRFRVPRTRGAASGAILLILGAWAALAPLIGPYFNLAYTPAPNDAWHWTAAPGGPGGPPGARALPRGSAAGGRGEPSRPEPRGRAGRRGRCVAGHRPAVGRSDEHRPRHPGPR